MSNGPFGGTGWNLWCVCSAVDALLATRRAQHSIQHTLTRSLKGLMSLARQNHQLPRPYSALHPMLHYACHDGAVSIGF